MDKLEDFDLQESGDENETPKPKEKPTFPTHKKFIKNRILRSAKYQEERRQQKKTKKQERKKRQREGGPKQIPHTIESLRVRDDTTVGDINSEENALVRQELACDEFSEYFNNSYEPKVLITFSDNPLRKTRIFGKELTRIIPNSIAKLRKRSSVKKMVDGAVKEGYSDILIINENQKQPNGLLVVHLPDGPTAHFKLSNVRITTELRKNHRNINKHKPEVILNNFSTRLGLTIGRMLGSLFHYRPEFKGQRAVTFHNQRDYIFFRHYRYNFDSEGKRTKLKELGPRFTLKLRSLQKGTFDSKAGNYLWIIEGRRHEAESNRRKFFL